MIENTKLYTLHIDTTQRDAKKLALFKQGELVDSLGGDFDVVSEIKILLEKHTLELKKDILEVMPNTGPGSFTGIKVGITIANTLNWVIGNNKTYEPTYGGEPNITSSK
jgi:tRNA A37 threonylcarbamoyladenosine modification protein TsaB